MKKINLLSIVLGFIVLTLFISGFNETLIAGVTGMSTVGALLAIVPVAATKMPTFGGLEGAKNAVKEYSSSGAKETLIDFIQREYEKSNCNEKGYDGHYEHLSGRSLIQERIKNPSKKLGIEILASSKGIRLGSDSFEKFNSLTDGTGYILMPATLALTIEMAMFRENILGDILAGSFGQDGLSVERLVKDDDSKYRKMSRGAIGSPLAEIKFKMSSKKEDMSQIGAKLKFPSRFLQAMTISPLDPQIQEMARQLETDRATDVFKVLVSGDANVGALSGASYLLPTTTTGSVVDDDVIAFSLFGKPQYFFDGYVLAGNAASLAKYYAGVAELSNYPGKMEAMGLSKPTKIIQWEEGVFASGGAGSDLVLKFNPKIAAYEFYQNGGIKIDRMYDEDQNEVFPISFANTVLKGHVDATVALDITH